MSIVKTNLCASFHGGWGIFHSILYCNLFYGTLFLPGKRLHFGQFRACQTIGKLRELFFLSAATAAAAVVTAMSSKNI